MSKTSKPSSTASSNNKNDGLIQFRPSPNFKHMKKYLKSKFEEDLMNEKKSEDKNKVNTAVQPPLPPNSPPPDIPPSFVLKQEVQDDVYEQAMKEPEEAPMQIQSTPQEPERKKPIMCKDFVRNTCARGSACVYAHEIDYSQLKGVYKFCRDFENGCCNRSICHFVHATTWEKEHFFRSAFLPAHALAHLKTPTTQPTTKVQKEVPQPYTNPPLHPLLSVTAAPLGPQLVCEAPSMPPPPPPKCDWRDIYDFVCPPPRNFEAIELRPKKCKRCDLTELRLQISKEQVAEAMRSTQEMDEKLEYITKKNNRLQKVLRLLLKPR